MTDENMDAGRIEALLLPILDARRRDPGELVQILREARRKRWATCPTPL